MEVLRKIQEVCAKYGVELNEQKYKEVMIVLDEQKEIFYKVEDGARMYTEAIVDEVIFPNVKVVQNEKGIQVPRWFSEEVQIQFNPFKGRTVTYDSGGHYIHRLSQGEFFQDIEKNEDFFQKMLPEEALSQYKLKKSFDLQEAGLFIKKEIKKYFKIWVKNLNKDERFEKMRNEMIRIVAVENN